ncbi:MAG: aldo/keto reductase [Haliea sp.]|uniref:potassium channel beta subunit family protein n=1 Tax=Haliea sp. TaxID=1932666 RepID=UPI0032EB91DB
MEYRRLGKSGLKLSGFSYGSWVTFGRTIDVNAAIDCLAVAYDAGVNFFDNAEGYAWGTSELIMGEALRRLNWSRDSFCVSSKVMFGSKKNPGPLQRGLSRKHVMEACEQALQRLGVDYLDLYFCHRPDPETPIEETVRAMDTLVQQGKVLYWGTSEWSAEQLLEACAVADRHHLTPPTMEQPEYNLFVRNRVEQEFEPLYEQHGIGLTTWSPLCSGVLTGKYNDGIPDGSRASLDGYGWLAKNILSEQGQVRIEVTKQLTQIALDLGVSVSHLALAWTRCNPRVSTTILGASSAAQLRDNLAAVDVVAKLTPEVQQKIAAVLQANPGLE